MQDINRKIVLFGVIVYDIVFIEGNDALLKNKREEETTLKKRVIAAGHICLDITPIFPGKKVEHLTDILSPGKLLNVKEADVHTGGSVANTGLAMKILGADVTLMGKIGADAFGDMVRNVLKKYEAEQGMLLQKGSLLLIP